MIENLTNVIRGRLRSASRAGQEGEESSRHVDEMVIAREVIGSASVYWREIARIILIGLSAVGALGIMLSWIAFNASISGAGPRMVSLPQTGDAAPGVFGFLLAAVVSLQLLTRAGTGKPPTPNVLGRSEVLATTALVLVPASLGSGVLFAIPALRGFPERTDLIALFGSIGAGGILAVFAADASLALGDHLKKHARDRLNRERAVERMSQELDDLKAESSGAVEFGPVILLIVAVAIPVLVTALLSVSPVRGAVPILVALSVVFMPLSAWAVSTGVSLISRRRWTDLVQLLLFAALSVAMLLVGWIDALMPEDVDTARSARDAAVLLLVLIAVLLEGMTIGLLGSWHGGPFWRWSIVRAENRLDKSEKRLAMTDQDYSRSTAADALAWAALATSLFFPPASVILSVAALARAEEQGGSSTRRVAKLSLVITTLVVVITVGIVVSVALRNPGWTLPGNEFFFGSV